jgi:hypothetical protein
VAITTPVPRPPCGLSARPRRPLDDALTPPWASADSLPFLSGAPDLSASIRPTCSPTVSPADAHSELGPRSLDPDRPFRERVCRAYSGPDVAYRLLQLHSFRHAGNQTRALVSSQGRRPRPPSLSSCHALSLAGAVTRGEPHYARFAPAPVPVPPAFTGLPDRDAVSNATPSWGIPHEVECRFARTGLWTQ